MNACIALTDRDLELLGYVGMSKQAPLELLAARFFRYALQLGSDAESTITSDVPTQRPLKAPARACEKRLRYLEKAGYVTTKIVRAYDGTSKTRAVTLTDRAALLLDVPRPRSVPARGRHHHMATLHAIERLRGECEKRGARIVNVHIESQQRRILQKGRQTQPGQEYECFADALLYIEQPNPIGEPSRTTVALEYVTSKYSDKDIIEKADSFRRFDAMIFVADTKKTAARVTRLTGEPCSCL
jgi:hypothetical protein